MTSDSARQSRIVRFFANPSVGFAGSLASVISIPLAAYFYVAVLAERKLTYYVHPVRTEFVRGDRPSQLNVEFDGTPLTRDVTAAQIAVWNAGNEAIRLEHILQSLSLCTAPRVDILDARVISSSRDVIEFSLDSNGFKDGCIDLFWKILEGNDGALIQVTYSGDKNVDFTLDGAIEGQLSPVKIISAIKAPTGTEAYKKAVRDHKISIVSRFFSAAMCFVLFVLGIADNRRMRKIFERLRTAVSNALVEPDVSKRASDAVLAIPNPWASKSWFHWIFLVVGVVVAISGFLALLSIRSVPPSIW